MGRKKIVFQTNAPWLKTGLAENGRLLMNWLARRDKYDLVYYCSQAVQGDPNLSRLPYKAYGAIPNEPNWMQQYGGDYGRIRDVHYGGRFVQDVIKAERPDVWVGSDDAWSYPGHYFNSEWFKAIHSILHITVDSVPVTPLAYEQASACKHFLTWTKFASDEMKRISPKTCGHVDYVYGACDIEKFRTITRAEQIDLRRAAGIHPDDTIFLQLSRNQLRKEMGNVLHGFAEFKKANPKARAKLLIHTHWADTSQGWDLPRLRDYFGINQEDVLATYYCRNCHRWEVKPYTGEDLDCRLCGAKKSQVTPNGFNEGVEDEDLYQIYGLADASLSVFTSGGFEYQSANSLLCGLPLACTNYSCGQDFCDNPIVYPVKWHSRHEVQSSFIKAANDIHSIADFMAKVHSMKLDERREWGARGRAWAEKTFSVDAVGTKWESLFDSLPPKDWSSITLTPPRKNDSAPIPQHSNSEQWIRALYQDILLCQPDPDGLKNWLASLERGISRDQIYQYFLNEARKDNAKNEPPKDLWSMIEKTGRKRALYLLKESIGDCVVSTQLFESFHRQYPNHDLYVATDPKHFDVFAGNPHVFRLLPYHGVMEQELAMTGAGGDGEAYFDVFFHPAIASQRLLGYLSPTNVAQDLEVAA